MLSLSNLFSSSSAKSIKSLTAVGGAIFYLGKNQAGELFADPSNLDQLDKFEAHNAAANELNSQLALLAQVRDTVLPLDGTEFDKNPREGVVAVTDYPLGGGTVDAVISKASHYKNLYDTEARVCDNGKTVTLFEEFRYEGEDKPLSQKNFEVEGRHYKVNNQVGATSVYVHLERS